MFKPQRILKDLPLIAYIFAIHTYFITCLIVCSSELIYGTWRWYEPVVFLLTVHLIGIGVTTYYHRYYTHRAYQFTTIGKWTARPVLSVLGLASWQGPPKSWAAVHLRHHQNVDCDEDPHGPIFSLADLGYVGLILYTPRLFDGDLAQRMQRRNRKSDWYERFVCGGIGYVLIGIVIPLAISTYFGVAIWYVAAVGFAFYETQFVNSIGHASELFARFPRRVTQLLSGAFFKLHQDEHCGNTLNARPWVGLLGYSTGGELYHNNHHKFPNSAKFGIRWCDVDTGWLTIKAMAWAGLVTGVNLPKSGQAEAKEPLKLKPQSEPIPRSNNVPQPAQQNDGRRLVVSPYCFFTSGLDRGGVLESMHRKKFNGQRFKRSASGGRHRNRSEDRTCRR